MADAPPKSSGSARVPECNEREFMLYAVGIAKLPLRERRRIVLLVKSRTRTLPASLRSV